MIDLLAILNAANSLGSSLTNFYSYLTKRSQTTNQQKKLVFRELRDNLKRLEHRNKPNVKIDRLIASLQNEAFTEAYRSNFNFNNLAVNAASRVTEKDLISRRNKRYLGWKCERLAESIDTKIVELKDLVSYYDDIEKAENNFAMKLNNLYFQILLLVILINKKDR